MSVDIEKREGREFIIEEIMSFVDGVEEERKKKILNNLNKLDLGSMSSLLDSLRKIGSKKLKLALDRRPHLDELDRLVELLEQDDWIW